MIQFYYIYNGSWFIYVERIASHRSYELSNIRHEQLMDISQSTYIINPCIFEPIQPNLIQPKTSIQTSKISEKI